MILAIDPDVKASGWALVCSDLECVRDLGTIRDITALPYSIPFWEEVTRIVIETMAVHRGRSGSVPGDLMAVQWTAGRIAGHLEAATGLVAEPVLAQDWKGTVPKSIHADRVYNELTPDERAMVDRFKGAARGEVLSAVGLAMWAAGRIGRSGTRER